jgi:hypothetical protein
LAIAVEIRQAAALLEIAAHQHARTSCREFPIHEHLTPRNQASSVEGGSAELIGSFTDFALQEQIVPDKLWFLCGCDDGK